MYYLRRILLVLTVFTAPLYASSYVTVAKSTSYPFPDEQLVHAQSAGDFIVQNTYGAPLKLYVASLPVGAAILPAVGVSNGCNAVLADPNDPTGPYTFSLDTGATCTLRLGYTSNIIGTQVFDATNPLALICKTTTASQYCSAIPTTTVTSSATPSNETTLSIVGSGDFAPDETSGWKITNTGSSVANNVHLSIVNGLNAYYDDSTKTTCPSILPGATCDLKVILKKDVPSHGMDGSLQIQGGNTLPYHGSTRLLPSLLHITPAFFVQPGEAAIKLINDGALDVTGLSIDSIAGSTTLHGVTQATSPTDPCGSSLAPGKSCEYLYDIAAEEAYGQQSLNVHFTPTGSSAKSLPSDITIQSVTPVINPDSSNQPQTVKFDRNATDKSFKVLNNSKFTWYAPKIVYKGDLPITIITNQSGGCSETGMPNGVPAGQECTVNYEYTAKKQSAAATSNTLEASGSNAQTTTTSTTEVGQVTFAKYTKALHANDLAIVVTNSTNVNLTISKIQLLHPTGQTSNVNWCEGSKSCSSTYTGDDICKVGNQLTSGATCLLWFEGLEAPKLIGSQISSFTPEITFTNSQTWQPTKAFTFTYTNDLYVGGGFNADSSTNQSAGLMLYDGSSMEQVPGLINNGFNKEVDAVKFYNGDLYVGGQFTVAGNTSAAALAKYNGSQWSAVGDGIDASESSFSVNALAIYDADLIIGGKFTPVNPSASSSKDIASWDGSHWGAFGTGLSSSSSEVNAISVDGNNHLVVGGTFANISSCGDAYKFFYFAQWEGSGQKCWVSHNNYPLAGDPHTWGDVDNTINALAEGAVPTSYLTEPYNTMFVGGTFMTSKYPQTASQPQYSNWVTIPSHRISSYRTNGFTTSYPYGKWTGVSNTIESRSTAPTFAGVGTKFISADNKAMAMVYDSYAQILYLGGQFDRLQSQDGSITTTNNVGGIVTATGSAINSAINVGGSSGLNNQVNALVLLPDYSLGSFKLFAGGLFSDPSPGVAVYNGTYSSSPGGISGNWEATGGGVKGGDVYALAIGSTIAIQ